NRELLPQLAKNGIRVRNVSELNAKRAAWARKYFQEEVLPMLTPLAVDASHPFPDLLNKSHNLLVRAKAQRGGEPLLAIVQELRRASRGDAVRLEVEADCPKDFIELLTGYFDLTEADVYKLNGPLSMTHLTPLLTNDAFAQLKDRPFQPGRDPALPPHADMFEVMRRQDVLLHHPYDGFEPIVDLVEEAARDPQVLAMKITLYRTSGDSPIVEALIEAADAGKQVTAIVELRARFDEAANIQWARRLEEAGAHVIYGVVGLKTHCKALLIVRRDADQLRRYVHLGTGNYH